MTDREDGWEDGWVVGTSEVLTIDCGTCELRATTACDDCVVSFVCDRPADEAVVIDVAEARVIRLLGRAGLVPGLRHRTA